jgi:hypothetical protein
VAGEEGGKGTEGSEELDEWIEKADVLENWLRLGRVCDARGTRIVTNNMTSQSCGSVHGHRKLSVVSSAWGP